MGEQHLGDYWLAAFDGQGRVIVGFRHGILRLDAEGSLLAPGPIPFDRVRIGKQTSGTLRGLVLHPDGSIFVSGGDERGGKNCRGSHVLTTRCGRTAPFPHGIESGGGSRPVLSAWLPRGWRRDRQSRSEDARIAHLVSGAGRATGARSSPGFHGPAIKDVRLPSAARPALGGCGGLRAACACSGQAIPPARHCSLSVPLKVSPENNRSRLFTSMPPIT